MALLCALLGLSPQLVKVLAENLGAVNALVWLSSLGDLDGYWYGAGLRPGDETAKSLILQAYTTPADLGTACTEKESL